MVKANADGTAAAAAAADADGDGDAPTFLTGAALEGGPDVAPPERARSSPDDAKAAPALRVEASSSSAPSAPARPAAAKQSSLAAAESTASLSSVLKTDERDRATLEEWMAANAAPPEIRGVLHRITGGRDPKHPTTFTKLYAPRLDRASARAIRNPSVLNRPLPSLFGHDRPRPPPPRGAKTRVRDSPRRKPRTPAAPSLDDPSTAAEADDGGGASKTGSTVATARSVGASPPTATASDLFRDGLPGDLVYAGRDSILPRPRIKRPPDRRKRPKKRKFLPAVSAQSRGPVAYTAAGKAVALTAPSLEFFKAPFALGATF